MAVSPPMCPSSEWRTRTNAHPRRWLYPAPLLLLQADRQPEGDFGRETRVEWTIVTLQPQGGEERRGMTGEDGRIVRGYEEGRSLALNVHLLLSALTVEASATNSHADRKLDNCKSMVKCS